MWGARTSDHGGRSAAGSSDQGAAALPGRTALRPALRSRQRSSDPRLRRIPHRAPASPDPSGGSRRAHPAARAALPPWDSTPGDRHPPIDPTAFGGLLQRPGRGTGRTRGCAVTARKHVPHTPYPELSTGMLLRPVKPPPSEGWRRLLYVLSGRLINLGESPRAARHNNLVAQVNRPLRGSYRIALLSLKGGVGKTTIAATLGATFASIRGDRVVAVDANPDRGTLSQKIPLETSATVRQLLHDAGTIERYSDVRRYTSQGPQRAGSAGVRKRSGRIGRVQRRRLQPHPGHPGAVLRPGDHRLRPRPAALGDVVGAGEGRRPDRGQLGVHRRRAQRVGDAGLAGRARPRRPGPQSSIAVINAVRPRSGKVDMKQGGRPLLTALPRGAAGAVRPAPRRGGGDRIWIPAAAAAPAKRSPSWRPWSPTVSPAINGPTRASLNAGCCPRGQPPQEVGIVVGSDNASLRPVGLRPRHAPADVDQRPQNQDQQQVEHSTPPWSEYTRAVGSGCVRRAERQRHWDHWRRLVGDRVVRVIPDVLLYAAARLLLVVVARRGDLWGRAVAGHHPIPRSSSRRCSR